jgi:hypothetical protein
LIPYESDPINNLLKTKTPLNMVTKTEPNNFKL